MVLVRLGPTNCVSARLAFNDEGKLDGGFEINTRSYLEPIRCEGSIKDGQVTTAKGRLRWTYGDYTIDYAGKILNDQLVKDPQANSPNRLVVTAPNQDKPVFECEDFVMNWKKGTPE